MIQIDFNLEAKDLLSDIQRLWEVSGYKIRSIEKSTEQRSGTPVFTVQGKYQAQGWTEWTQGFQFGSAILQFDATENEEFLEVGRKNTVTEMASHVSHIGVHDHGFNNVSTYGNLRRMMLEGKIPQQDDELHFYELALKITGAIQASRWSRLHGGGGYVYSFNGPQSLFSDTIRSMRALVLSHSLGHALMGENDERFNLLGRAIDHARATAEYNVYYGEGRDKYDTSETLGRVVHESLFNVNDGRYRCPSTQQGYSPFSTWTRGLAWVLLGYPEQLEFLKSISDEELGEFGGREDIENMMLKAAKASAEFFIRHTPADGVPYWDTGAPGLVHLGNYLERAADPFNDHEPVDSSAAAISAQGLIRLGIYLGANGEETLGSRYYQAGLTTFKTLLSEPYLSLDSNHEGLLLHSIYHRPRDWDYTPEGSKIPRGEACMWGDYHFRELALYVERLVKKETYYCFWGPC